MASSCDVAKKVLRLQQQLADAADSATVLRILGKLKDLDVTLNILAETGIGKTVNSLRRHEQAGDFAKSIVKGWKKLLPKESTSNTADSDVSVKDKLDKQIFPCMGRLTVEELNNNCLTSHSRSEDSSDESSFKTGKRDADSEKQQCEEQERKGEQNENQEKDHQENLDIFQNKISTKKIKIHEVKLDDFVSMKKKNDDSDRKSKNSHTWHENNKSEGTQKSRSDYREIMKSRSDSGRCGSVKSNKKSNPLKQSSKRIEESFPFDSSGKNSKMLKLMNATDVRSSGISRSSEAPNTKRKRSSSERQECKPKSENEDHSKNKKAKIKHKGSDQDSGQQEPPLSFESFLNYDANLFSRKERQVKKPRKLKYVKEATKNDSMKSFKSPVTSIHGSSPKRSQESLLDLINIPLPAVLPECEKPFSVEYFERRVEKESELCDVSEESAVFTGQRLNKKMQVYSGAKTVFLPAMMSLYQQCIRTLQNNINLLYETGGVPFEILEPVLERCTPEQLLRIEECNPLYIGVTDHLWGRHCQRDFKDSKLQEYESWKEMYIRLSEERERKLQRLTKSIVSAHSKKPKGRQVKMAFIHTVAKPPRDVRIQQEIHGTAVQQPHQRCSVKAQDNRPRQSSNELNRSSSTSSGASNTQDPRKKTRVAPMMAKSLKAFKKQLGRR